MTDIDSLYRRLARLPIDAAEIGIADELEMLKMKAEFGEHDEHLFEFVSECIAQVEANLLESPNLEPHESAGLDAGDYTILTTMSGNSVAISFDEKKINPVTHMMVGGASGTGKSSLQGNIAAQAGRSMSTLVLDANRFYRTVRAMRDQHEFVRFSHLKIDLFRGIGSVPFHVSDQVITREIAATFGLQFGEYEMGESLRDLRLQGKANLPHLMTTLANKRYQGFTRRSQYRDSAMLILTTMRDGAGEVYQCAEGMDLELMLKGNLVIEIDELLPIHQAFFARFLFEQLHLIAMARRE